MNPKPGVKTTEFRISLIVAILGALLASGILGEGDVSKVAGSILTAFSTLGYGISRGIAKHV